jgi:hypothetical protein
MNDSKSDKKGVILDAVLWVIGWGALLWFFWFLMWF